MITNVESPLRFSAARKMAPAPVERHAVKLTLAQVKPKAEPVILYWVEPPPVGRTAKVAPVVVEPVRAAAPEAPVKVAPVIPARHFKMTLVRDDGHVTNAADIGATNALDARGFADWTLVNALGCFTAVIVLEGDDVVFSATRSEASLRIARKDAPSVRAHGPACRTSNFNRASLWAKASQMRVYGPTG